MQIKSLRLQGFKSFYHDREIHFPDGITAVVGPNGCGKSNIVDAICWVLGEQSPRRLRGKKMEEILFNGSEHFPPTGMARVSLQLARKKRGFPHPFSGLEELSVERLLFRTGESEYRINQTPVRLKDVVDLFMDTGSGNRTYSIIEQGHIGEIIGADPEKIRGYIEGAAGIQKFKVRKESASRKMGATEENLRHIEAVLSEIRRQMNSLNRQAQKARRYQKIKEEITRFECFLASREYRQLLAHEEEESTSQRESTQRSDSLLAELGGQEAAAESLMTGLIQKKASAEKRQDHLWRHIQELNQLENRRLYLQQSLADVRHRVQETEKHLEKAREQFLDAQGEKRELAEAIEELKRRGSRVEEIVLEARLKVASLLSREKELQQEIDDAKESLFHLMTRRAEIHNLRISLQDKKNDLIRRCEKNCAEISQIEEENRDFSRKKEDLDGFLKRARSVRSFLSLERTALEVYRKELKLEHECAKSEAGAVLGTLNKKGSRLHSLLELQENYEGYQDGVRAVMQRRQRGGDEQCGVLGLVADLLETEPEYETALETALGERLQSIVVQEQHDGLQAIEFLKHGTLGRGTFIPVSLRGKRNLDGPRSPLGVPLLEVVKTKPGFREISEYLLGDVVFVEDLSDGLDLWKRNGSHNRIVTKEGELIDPHGVITGGSVNGTGGAILKNKREIKSLEEELSLLHEDHEAKQRLSERVLRKTRFNEGDLERLQQRSYRLDIEILKVEKDLQQNVENQRKCLQKAKVLAAETSQYQEEREGLDHKEGLNEQSLQELDRLCLEKEQLLCSLNREIRDLIADRDFHREELNEKELEAQLLREKESGLARSARQLSDRIADLSASIDEKEQEESAAAEKGNGIDAELDENGRQTSEMETARKRLEGELAQENEVIEKMKSVLTDREIKIKETNQELGELRRSQEAAHLRLVEIRMKKENLFSQIWERHQIDLAVAVSSSVPEMAEEDEVIVRRDLDKAKTVLKGLGEINPTAIEEFEDLQNRHAFYGEQVDDLKRSMGSLQRLIQRINRITKTRFLEAFQAIDEQFQHVFPLLFNGGRAFLQLDNEKEPLESGVSIVAQPPGKKLQSLGLFSGGEKTMAALALILAIFQYKPSPFCVLDEVDAALDDINVGRFNGILKNISKSAQFILVTHNKQTMEIANTLYGITMEQPGVSQVVSVNIE